ncbi:hypothetical protein F2Q69_00021083 [Brassica cretica]|uniref:Uncharacterized protein n=1 Tax=Brassica cretica TaxID=69181 RepID=A0A8S9Q8Z1_BRACR|nr:hypothetical protein F2Q69_00021083 [Brassica cretica]
MKKIRIWGGWVELSGLVWVSVDARGKLQLAAPLPLEKLVIVSGSQLPSSYSVVDVDSYSIVDVDSYSGDAVGPQRFHLNEHSFGEVVMHVSYFLLSELQERARYKLDLGKWSSKSTEGADRCRE